MHYFINIGTNLGNLRLNLSRALKEVAGEFGWFEVSHAVESEPWGFESGHRFMNIGAVFVSADEPQVVLEKLQAIERKIDPTPHRDADGNYVDRVVDIDIVAVDELVVDEPGLKVPHPCLAQRKFFLAPMVELAPVWRHPVNGLTPAEMLEALGSDEKESVEEGNEGKE